MTIRRHSSVLILAKGFPPTPGGVESYSKAIADAYASLGRTVTVVSAQSRDTCHLDSAPLIKYNKYDIAGRHQPTLLAGLVQHLLGLRIRKLEPDVIHATTWRMALPALLVYPSVPLIVTCHGNEILVKGALGQLMRWVLMRARRIVCVSNYTRNLLERQAPSTVGKTIVAYNGILTCPDWESVSRKWVAPPPSLRIFTVCRHEKRKNIVAAVEAVGRLKHPAEYYIAGTGPMSVEVAHAITTIGMQSKIHLLGKVSDEHLRELYATSHIFLHPQIELLQEGDVEGFGLVVADSMAHACVPVVGKNGGTAELVVDNQTGVALSECSPREIASRLDHLMKNFVELGGLGAAAKRFADKNFSWETHVSLATHGIHRE